MKVHGYTLTQKIRSSNVGDVFQGTREVDGLKVIVKTGGAKLSHEMALLQKGAGAGVPHAIELVETGEGSALVIEHFGSGDLSELVHRGALTPERVVDYGVKLASILSRVHGLRLIHRDIKPSNILFDEASQQVMLTDFGTAIELPVGARRLPPADLIGTLAYVSPEATGRMSEGIDRRSDLYSLGVTLFQLLTGRVPFESSEAMEVVSAHLTVAPPTPRSIRPEIPASLEAIVLKLMAKQPGERYQSAAGLLADLQQAQRQFATGDLAAFTLGLSDFRRPKPSRALYGREAQRTQLDNAFLKCRKHGPQLVYLEGNEFSGAKGVVEHFLNRHPGAVDARADLQESSDKPLDALTSALGSMAQRLVALDDDTLADLRKETVERLGAVGRAVTDVVPGLADVLGPQPELPALGDAETKARLQHAVRSLMSGLTASVGGVLFMNRVELADAPSLSLVQTILDDSDAKLVVVLAGTDFSRFKSTKVPTVVPLPGLTRDEASQWFSECLELAPEAVEPLSSILLAKAEGAPGLMWVFLQSLVESGVVSQRDGRFVWELEAVKAAQPPAALASIVADSIRQLAPENQEILATLATAQEPVTPELIAHTLGVELKELSSRAEALEGQGLLTRASQKLALGHPSFAKPALAAVSDERRKTLRNNYASHALRQAKASTDEQAAIKVAPYLSLEALAQLSADERLFATRALLAAGQKLASLLAYERAEQVFQVAAQALDRDTHRETWLEAQLQHAKTLTTLERHDDAERQYLALCAMPSISIKETGLVYSARVRALNSANKKDESVTIGLAGLATLGIKIGEKPSPIGPFFNIVRTRHKFWGKDVIKNLPLTTDERTIAIHEIGSAVSLAAALQRRDALMLSLAFAVAQINLTHGVALGSINYLSTYAIVQLNILKKVRGVREIADGLRYHLDHGLKADRCRSGIALSLLVDPWLLPRADVERSLHEGLLAAIDAGEPVWSAAWLSSLVGFPALSGTPIPHLLAVANKHRHALNGEPFIKGAVTRILSILESCATGKPISDDDRAVLTKPSPPKDLQKATLLFSTCPALFALGEFELIRNGVEETRASFKRDPFTTPSQQTLWLYDGLIAAAEAATNKKSRKSAQAYIKKYRGIDARHGTTFATSMIHLLEGRLAHALGQVDKAHGHYSAASNYAETNNEHHYAGLANELRAELLLASGRTNEATLFLTQAYAAYTRWGHASKLAQLRTRYPALAASLAAAATETASRTHDNTVSHTSSTHSHTISSGTSTSSFNESMNLATVLKVSQSISTQLTAAGVTQSVLEGICENAGAERAVLVMHDGAGNDVVIGEIDKKTYTNIQLPLKSYPKVPGSLLRLVKRTLKPIVIGDALTDKNCANDPFVLEARSRSMAVIPILQKDVYKGCVVLENRQVAKAFTSQLVSIARTLVTQASISLDNASLYENLEARVQERTAQLHARNTAMRLVLDNVVQGLLTVDRQGQVAPEMSAVINEWYEGQPPRTLAEIFAKDPKSGVLLGVSWEQLLEGFLPTAMCIEQLPRHMRMNGKIFDVEWKAIASPTHEVSQVLVVISDVTEATRRRNSEAQLLQLIALVERLHVDPAGTHEFLSEAAVMVQRLPSETHPDASRRLIHTLKGNAAIFGLSHFAQLCHQLESDCVEQARAANADEVSALQAAWAEFSKRLAPFTHGGSDSLSVDKNTMLRLLSRLRDDQSAATADFEALLFEPLAQRFARFTEQAKQLGQKLRKGPITVHSQHRELLLKPDVWAPFWSAFVHALRNAVDHGLESPEERSALQKPQAAITLAASLTPQAFTLEIRDDGRGIPWDKIREKALSLKLPANSQDELAAAIFVDGVSSKAEADEYSGRGVGMSALKEACAALGGRIELESTLGSGTTWRFIFPPELARVRPHSDELRQAS